MADIVIHRPGRLKSGSVGRSWLETAKPGPAPRLDGSAWDFTRQGFAHARIPRFMSYSLGLEDPIKRRFEEDKSLQDSIKDQFPDLSLDELLVSPTLPDEVATSIRERIGTYLPGTPDRALMSLYEPAGYHLDSSAVLYPNTYNFVAFTPLVVRGPTLSAPFVIREVGFLPSDSSYQPNHLITTFAIDGYGTLLEYSYLWNDLVTNKGHTSRGLDLWYLFGSITPYISITFSSSGPVQLDQSASVWVVVEPLIRKS
jgi:hypothetical protein